jgi:hypothetical protein
MCMICPYCGIGISANWDEWDEDCYPVPSKEDDYDEGYNIVSGFCPDCQRFIVRLQHGNGYTDSQYGAELQEIDNEVLIYPKFPINKQINTYVPKRYETLFQEALQVNSISPRASATLSRYLLQNILHEELKIKKRNLADEISELEKMQSIPSTLIAMLQVFRKVANFGAHPKKSTNSKEIIDVEKGEADVMLELIEELFDYIFIKPKRQEEILKKISEKYGIEPYQS